MPTEAGPEHRAEDGLGRFLTEHREEILSRWEAGARRLPTARQASRHLLRDALPALLHALSEALLCRDAASEQEAMRQIEEHALQRLEHGFDLSQAIVEYALLRDTVLQMWWSTPRRALPPEAFRRFHRLIDEGVALLVGHFTEAQARTLKAYDRLASASLESQSLTEFLQRLVGVVMDALPTVDSAAILLREGNELRVRAVRGLGREAERGFSVKVGEGFAGTIAATRKPMLLRAPSEGSLLQSPILRSRRVRTLYGVPLVADDRVLGVAHIDSLSGLDFGQQDLRVLHALAIRATSAIYQRMLRQEADRRAAELSAVIESVPDGIIISDAKRIEHANRRALEIMGLSEALAKEPHQIRLDRLQARDLATGTPLRYEASGLAEGLQGKSSVRELSIRLPDGGERLIRFSTAPVEYEGRIQKAVTIATDITRLKRYEAERARLLERERAARQRAEAALRVRDRVLAVVSHDLRNPLGAIQTGAELILRRSRALDARHITRHAEAIARSAARMDHLIADLVDVASLEAGRLQVRRSPESVASLVDEALHLQEALALEKGIRLVREAHAGDAVIEVDRDRILQVFSNLIGNGLKYSGSGGLITVRISIDTDVVCFDISDTGPGIPAEELPHLFDPYWSQVRQGQRGTGLGLSIARGIVEAHGGRIWAQSVPGQGSTFSFCLPRSAP